MEETNNEQQKVVDLQKVFKNIWACRRKFYKLWAIVFVVSCIWVLPQPRYYTCEVALAPEAAGEDLGGGLASIASSFGFNLGGMGGTDAIYPMLYPDLFESPEFIVSLFDIQIKTLDGEIETNYHDYLKKHQKQNWLTWPFRQAKKWVTNLIEPETDVVPGQGTGKSGYDAFHLSTKDFKLVAKIQDLITCSNDKKTDVTTIVVQDQDPLVCALLADSVRCRLQGFITDYRTAKARQDLAYYQALAEDALVEYQEASHKYSDFVDSHTNTKLQSYQQQAADLESVKDIKHQTYVGMCTQLQACRAKLQEKTPAFTVLKSAIVPIKPAGPKRMLFVAAMLILSSIFYGVWISRKDLHISF